MLRRIILIATLAIFSLSLFVGCAGINPVATGAKVSINENRWGDAEKNLLKGIRKMDPNSQREQLAEVFYLLGHVYAHKEEVANMKIYFDKSLAITDKFKSEMDKDTKRQFYAALKNGSDVFQIGVAKSRAGKTKKAMKNFKTAEKSLKMAFLLNPKSFDVLKLLGYTYLQIGDKDSAKKILAKALEVKTDDVQILKNMAILLSNEKKYKKAFEYYKRIEDLAIKTNKPVDKGTLNAIADYYKTQGKYDEVFVYYNKILKIDPKDKTVLFNAGQTYITLKKYDKALEYLTKLITIDPSDQETVVKMAIIYFSQKKFKKAIDLLAPKFDSLDAKYKKNASDILSQAYAKTGNGSLAKKFYNIFESLK